jgi:hypothetical protein
VSQPVKAPVNIQRLLISVASIGAVIAVVIFLTPHLEGRIQKDDMMPLIAGFMLFQMGVTMTLIHIARPKDAPQQGQNLSQVLSMALGGLTLIVPVVGPIWVEPAPIYGLFLIMFVVSSVATWRVWRGADELMKRMLADSSVIGYMVITSALCLYAVGERLGLMSGVTAWAFLGFASLSNLFVSSYVIFRSGMGKHLPEE